MHSGFYFLHLLLAFVVALWVFTSVLRRKEIEMIATRQVMPLPKGKCNAGT